MAKKRLTDRRVKRARMSARASAINTEALAERLVRRGVASRLILGNSAQRFHVDPWEVRG